MVQQLSELKILIRGGGEMASGIAHRLHQCRMKVLITEVAAPTAVRRTVAFAEAIYRKSQEVEGVRAIQVHAHDEICDAWRVGAIPVLIDPEANIRRALKPEIVVDAIMAKKPTGTDKSFAPLVIGVGPGFTAGIDVHAVVESNRGYNLGRVLWAGDAEAHTGVPGAVEGYTSERVLRSPRAGLFRAFKAIGDLVEAGEIVAQVEQDPIKTQIPGILRGLLVDGIEVEKGEKAGDIDPRGKREYCYLISEKARAISGGVIEAILHSLGTVAL